MYCSNCGKEINNDARFCSGCGTDINNGREPVTKSNIESIETFIKQKGIKIICLILMLGSTLFVAFGGVMPILSGGIEMFDYSLTDEWSLFELLDFATYLEDYIESVSAIKLVIYLAIGCYFISVITAGKVILSVVSRGKNEAITKLVTISMVSGEIAFVIVFILKNIVNHITSEEFYGMEFLTTTTVGWGLLIIPLVNLFIFKRGYLGAAYYDDEKRITKDKVCMVCKTI